MEAQVTLGAGELVLLLLLGFIAFGPRRKNQAASSLSLRIATVLAVCGPALLVMDQAGSRLGFGLTQRAWLAAACALSSFASLFLISLARRYLARL